MTCLQVAHWSLTRVRLVSWHHVAKKPTREHQRAYDRHGRRFHFHHCVQKALLPVVMFVTWCRGGGAKVRTAAGAVRVSSCVGHLVVPLRLPEVSPDTECNCDSLWYNIFQDSLREDVAASTQDFSGR
jgi:hypothetical protein